MVRFACWKDPHLHMRTCSLVSLSDPVVTIPRHSLFPATSLRWFTLVGHRAYHASLHPCLYNRRLTQERTRHRWPALLAVILDNPSHSNTFLFLLTGYYSYLPVPVSPSCSWTVPTFFLACLLAYSVSCICPFLPTQMERNIDSHL